MFAGAFFIIAMFSGCQPAVEPRGKSSGRVGARSQTRPPSTLSSGAQQVSSLQGAEERCCCSCPGRSHVSHCYSHSQMLTHMSMTIRSTLQFIFVFQNLLPQIACPVSLLPLLHPSPPQGGSNPLTMAVKGGGLLDGALPDLVLEMGYHFTNSVDECRASLLQLGGREVYASTVAKVFKRASRSQTIPPQLFPGDWSDGANPHWS